MPTWDAQQYLRFADERTRACSDLVARVPLQEVARGVDLGCGPGNSTEVIKRRWPAAQIVGVDSSDAMIARARADHPEWPFEAGDVTTWTPPEPCDLVLSNAVLQWVPGHTELLPRLVGMLRQGGVLAIQMPKNLDAPNHALMREVARRAPFAGKIQERSPFAVGEPGFYYDVLAAHCSHVDIWISEYMHVMPDAAAIVEWGRGTGLRPYLEPLTPDEQAAFLEQYTAEIARAFLPESDGKVLFPFRRLFMVAVR